jgi:hypothetical protein
LLVLLSAPLRAQLDPRLQATVTNFTDIYAQNANIQAKPELLTLFDFSGSMASLMFHPLYQNMDLNDADDYNYMSFTLVPAGGGVTTTTNTYTITAKGDKCACTATAKVTVTASGVVTWGSTSNAINPCGSSNGSSAPGSITITADATAQSAAKASISLVPQCNTNSASCNSTPYTLTIGNNSGSKAGSAGQSSYQIQNLTVTNNSSGATYSSTDTIPAGTTIKVVAILDHNIAEGEPSSDDGITWNVGGGTLTQLSPGVYQSVITYYITPWQYAAPVAGNPAQLNLIGCELPSGTSFSTSPTGLATGMQLTLTDSYITQGANTKIIWSVTQSNNCGSCPGINGGSATTVSVTPGTNVTWTIPTCTSSKTTGATAAYVSVSLNASAGVNYTASGLTYVNALTAGSSSASPTTGLVRPDGTMLTATNFQNPSGTLNGTSSQISDVRNWIRQASHVRFTSGSRSIDIPIPWNIAAYGQTAGGSNAIASPVADQTIIDLDNSPIPVGSGTSITFDTCYQVENVANAVFTGAAGVALSATPPLTTVYLWSVVYRPAYISWLFNGQYSSTPGSPNYTTNSHLQGTYIVFDSANASKVYGQTSLSWGQAFGPATPAAWGNITVPNYNSDGSLNATSPTITLDASNYAIPALTRAQAVKKAAITTWIANQAAVYWAFRFLDYKSEALNGTASTIDNNSQATKNNTVAPLFGDDSAWTVLNNSSSSTHASTDGMKRIASMFATGPTPLTYALARSYAQFTDPKSVFNAVEGTAVSQCAGSFLILFTDGIDNNGLGADADYNVDTYTPYLTGAIGSNAVFNAALGNTTILSHPTWINPSFCQPFSQLVTPNSCWNLYTFAGIAAHMADDTLGAANVNYLAGLIPGSSPNTTTPNGFMPFAITQRNGTPFTTPHRITTMTVGVSLGGYYNQQGSPKFNLFLAAVVGDPNTRGSTTTTLGSFHQFVPPVVVNNVVTVQNDWVPIPSDPTSYPKFGQKSDHAVYYFDGSNPAALSTSLSYAVALALGRTTNNTTTNPNLPYTGATFGQQIYIGKFEPPKSGGPVWPGDLLMLGTQDVNGIINILDTSGNPTTDLSQTNAMWSAATALTNNRLWSSRTLYTRLPGNPTNTELGLHLFTDVGTAFSNAMAADNTAGLMNFVATDNLTPGGTAQVAVIQNAAGGNTLGTVDANNRPTTNRTNIMGDIINSSPTTQTYTLSDTDIKTGIAAHPALSLGANAATSFRVVLAGTNQGWLHCFGEVSATEPVKNNAGVQVPIVQAAVDELWAFMPTDFLPYLDFTYGPNAPGHLHKFMVDGSPSIYFLDLPGTDGTPANGVLDYTAAYKLAGNSERAIVLIGEGEGGRSYYAIDITNPFSPSLAWSLVPDEAAWFPASRNLTGLPNFAYDKSNPQQPPTAGTLQYLIWSMGFSTCTPAYARVLYTDSTSTQTVRDVVFLGGGLSVPQVEHNFPTYPSPPANQQTYLGRSVIAIDVNSGNVLAAYQFSNAGDSSVATTLADPVNGNTTAAVGVGPVVAGVVPTEVIVGSGMAQRAYFTDRNGGLWAWGSKGVVSATSTLPSGYLNYRMDTSDLAAWTVDGNTGSAQGIRKVYQDGSGIGSIYTALPAPFVVSSFPGVGKITGTSQAPSPAAIGVAMVSGDRNNPMDPTINGQPSGCYYLGQPTNFRLTVVFDRQDSRVWGLDSQNGSDTGILDANLQNATNWDFGPTSTNTCADSVGKYITPGCTSYYLAPSSGTPSFGYYVNFPGVVNGMVSKSLISPAVVSGSLFYTYFTPTSYDPCTGGNGNSYSNIICDVINPIVADTRTNISCLSGNEMIWSGVTSGYIGMGTRGVIQGGTVPIANPAPGAPAATPQISTFQGMATNRYPKIRVWRTVSGNP